MSYTFDMRVFSLTSLGLLPAQPEEHVNGKGKVSWFFAAGVPKELGGYQSRLYIRGRKGDWDKHPIDVLTQEYVPEQRQRRLDLVPIATTSQRAIRRRLRDGNGMVAEASIVILDHTMDADYVSLTWAADDVSLVEQLEVGTTASGLKVPMLRCKPGAVIRWTGLVDGGQDSFVARYHGSYQWTVMSSVDDQVVELLLDDTSWGDIQELLGLSEDGAPVNEPVCSLSAPKPAVVTVVQVDDLFDDL